MIEFKFAGNGLIPVIIQDVNSGEVLMMAYMDRVALKRTLKERQTVFYSRSRKKYWVKGESSGHAQQVVDALTDCDRDTVLIRVKQKGGACHLGYRSCFVYKLDSKGGLEKITQKKVFDPERVYSKK
jgi:phosphoribosyl-AMP cyclohydrolase